MTPLLASIVAGKADIVMLLVDRRKGAKVTHLRIGLRSQGWAAQSPLSVAAAYGHLNFVNYLLQRGADPRMPNYPGGNLHWADLQFQNNVPDMRREQILNVIRNYKSKLPGR